MSPARLVATGSFFPETRLTNADLEKQVDTNDAWIRERTGIRERRVLDKGLATSDMAVAAARDALDTAGWEAESLDLIILATVTPDMFCPAGAVRVQEKLGAHAAFAFDVSAACAGSLLGLDVAARYLQTGGAQRALVIGAESLSRIVNPKDRNTCVLFGDAAGAMLLEASDNAQQGLKALVTHSDGRHWDWIHMPGGGSQHPAQWGGEVEDFTVHMAGREVFKFAVRSLQDVAAEVMDACDVTASEIDWVVAHQANRRILDALASRMDIPMDRFVINIEWTGNTSSASVPTSLDLAIRDGRIKRGDTLLLLAIGAGMTWSGGILVY